MSKRPLAPSLLNKLDDYLLVNRPDTWSTRIHLVLYYGFFSLLAIGTICFFIPNDPRSESFWGVWTFATVVLSLIAFTVWLVYLFRFNVFKQYGKIYPGDRLKTFLIYYFIIALMITPSFIPRLVESFRADQAYSNEELVHDMNKMNELICEAEYGSFPTDWHSDTLKLTGGYQYGESMDYHYVRLDSAELHNRREEGDSIRKVNDSLYIVSTFFNCQFVDNYQIKQYSGLHLNTTLDIYNLVFKHHKIVSHDSAIIQLKHLTKKYACQDCPYYYGSYYNSNQDIRSRYNVAAVNSGIEHIAYRKYYLSYDGFSEILLFLNYVALTLTLFVYIFRHSTVKTFFLSILFGIILSILSGLFAILFKMRGEGFTLMVLFYYIIFFICSLTAFGMKHRSVINGIAINLVVFMTAFIPLTCVGFYYSTQEYSSSYVDERHDYGIAQIVGPVLLLILIETLFKRLYRAWYASPEE